MICPVCQTHLQVSERQGVEIDYCPQCRGVWLDRGELDKIIERSHAGFRDIEYKSHDPYEFRDHNQHKEHQYKDHYYKDHDYHHKKHKKKSFLEDIFDF